MERRALELGLDFVRVEPRVTRNNDELGLGYRFHPDLAARAFLLSGLILQAIRPRWIG